MRVLPLCARALETPPPLHIPIPADEYHVTIPGARALKIAFSPRCQLRQDMDSLQVLRRAAQGYELVAVLTSAGRGGWASLNVEGETALFRLVRTGGGTRGAYGFRARVSATLGADLVEHREHSADAAQAVARAVVALGVACAYQRPTPANDPSAAAAAAWLESRVFAGGLAEGVARGAIAGEAFAATLVEGALHGRGVGGTLLAAVQARVGAPAGGAVDRKLAGNANADTVFRAAVACMWHVAGTDAAAAAASMGAGLTPEPSADLVRMVEKAVRWWSDVHAPMRFTPRAVLRYAACRDACGAGSVRRRRLLARRTELWLRVYSRELRFSCASIQRGLGPFR